MRRSFSLLLVALFILAPLSAAHAQRRGRTAPKQTMSSSTQPTNSSKAAAPIASVLEPSQSPLVSFRLLFMTGAASDPAGKEGVAALTAAMLSEGGSRAMPYEQIVEAFYPMAAGFGSQVDKEMTVFSGTTHVDNLDKYYGLVRDMLLDPGFREDDFTRIREDTINYLKVSLRGNNDEELGKEALYNSIYKGHPYGHNNVGTVESLQKLTLDECRPQLCSCGALR